MEGFFYAFIQLVLFCVFNFINFVKISFMISEKLKKGKLLIAEPSIIGDLSFNRSVILLADHTKRGSVGFIINKPLRYKISDIIPDIKSTLKIYNGGPVEQDNLYFIHNVPELIPNSIEISNGIYWGGEYEITKRLINEGKITKKNIRFFLGYTGWGEEQLETEMAESTWIIVKNNYKNKIIGKSATQFWKKQIIELGGDYLVWINAPKNPSLN
jgi:putative transcriptional regulator